MNFRTLILPSCLLTLVTFSQGASANKFLDYIRSYDLNDYSLGVSLSTSQNPYADSDDSAFFYPYLTSFRHHAFTDDLLIFTEGDVGFRKVFDNDWVLGAYGRVQTLGLGDSELVGIDERRWTLEVAPVVGFRRWPVHIQLKTYFEILDRHEGMNTELEFSYPLEWQRGYLVPAFELIHQSSDFTNYYYGVTTAETTPERPGYQAGDALNLGLKLRMGYAISDHWLLSGTLGIEKLDSEITASPLVDRDSVWAMSLGLAYNADVFNPKDFKYSMNIPKTLIRFSALNATMDTTLTQDTSEPGSRTELDLEDLFGLPEKKTVSQLDVIVRLAGYHRFELGYTQFGRSGFEILDEDIRINDVDYLAGTGLEVDVETKILRLSYGFSIMMDDQKELGVMAGVHRADVDARFSADTGQQENRRASPVLPVIGVFGNVKLGRNTLVSAKIQIFRMDFDRYEGSLSAIQLDIQKVIGRFGFGAGYSYYSMDLDSSNADVSASLEFRHHGPFAFMSVRF